MIQIELSDVKKYIKNFKISLNKFNRLDTKNQKQETEEIVQTAGQKDGQKQIKNPFTSQRMRRSNMFNQSSKSSRVTMGQR